MTAFQGEIAALPPKFRWVYCLKSTLMACTRKIRNGSILILMLLFGSYHSLALGSPGIPDEKALSTIGTVFTFFPSIYVSQWTSDGTSDLFEDRDLKVLLRARDDAAAFVASDGDHRGAFLEVALGVMSVRGMEQSDMALATWILTEFSDTDP